MKKLNIKGWFDLGKSDIETKGFRIKSVENTNGLYSIYLISDLHPNAYRADIMKEAVDGDTPTPNTYQLWLYSIVKDFSYPMGISLSDMMSRDNFIKYLENIIQVADKGDGFCGDSGDWRITKQKLYNI